MHGFWLSPTNRTVFFSLVDEPHKKGQKKLHEACNTVPGARILVGFSQKEPWGSSALATALEKTMYSTYKWLKGASESPEASETKKYRWPAHQSRSTNGGGMF